MKDGKGVILQESQKKPHRLTSSLEGGIFWKEIHDLRRNHISLVSFSVYFDLGEGVEKGVLPR